MRNRQFWQGFLDGLALMPLWRLIGKLKKKVRRATGTDRAQAGEGGL